VSPFRKVIAIGLDGFEPSIVETLLAEGRLPNLARIAATGGRARLATTCPAQTPVACSTFATGTNPGGHGIFDFIRRDPKTYLPDLSLNRYERKNPFVMPRAVNLRRGVPVWELLRAAGVGATVLRCPCTYPPDPVTGHLLSGMGVPDLRGGLGTSTFYSSDPAIRPEENENVVHVAPAADGRITTQVIGPRNPKSQDDLHCDITIEIEAPERRVVITSGGDPPRLVVGEGEWSGWLKLRFRAGLLATVHGMVRFHLVRLAPDFELYASPVNFLPGAPLFPISSPPAYAGELEAAIGTYYTTGMVEDHGGLQNGRFDESAYLRQCDGVLDEREAMLHHELARFEGGLLFCLFDTPDRICHMFWRFREPGHPANRDGRPEGHDQVVEDHYHRCDAIAGRVLSQVDGDTLLMIFSDHGFGSFQRGLHLNTWLQNQGLLVLRPGVRPGEAGELFGAVDWDRTRAYALGLGGIYLNLRGREERGIVAAEEAADVATAIVDGLTGLVDETRGEIAVRSVACREDVYSGPFAGESPDLVVLFNRSYRVSWPTALGGVPAGLFEDNVKRWSGDHIIDPALVPGVLFMNRPFRSDRPHLVDLAPTILAALGLPKGPAMEGESLLL
jgi:predicted AlkP superfamily phosphohydrolase/phosphomutase